MRGRQTLGERIRRYRESAGLTQEALARAADIGRVTLVRLEKGEQTPRFKTLEAISKALGIRVPELLVETRLADRVNASLPPTRLPQPLAILFSQSSHNQVRGISCSGRPVSYARISKPNDSKPLRRNERAASPPTAVPLDELIHLPMGAYLVADPIRCSSV